MVNDNCIITETISVDAWHSFPLENERLSVWGEFGCIYRNFASVNTSKFLCKSNKGLVKWHILIMD